MIVDAQVLDKHAHWSLKLRIKQGATRASRTLRAESCEELLEAASLMFALAIDPSLTIQNERDANVTEPAPPLAPTTSREPNLVQTITETKAAPKEEARSERRAWRVSGGVLVDLGMLPDFGLGPSFAFGHHFGSWRAELSLMWLAPRASEGDEERVTVSAWAVSPTGCVRLFASVIDVETCSGLELGQTAARGLGLAKNERVRSEHTGATAALRMILPFGEIAALTLEPCVMIPFQRSRFVSLDTQGESPRALHEPAAVSARGKVSLELWF